MSINNDTVILFGKFKGKTLNMLLDDKFYCEWILAVVMPTGQLKQVKDFISK